MAPDSSAPVMRDAMISFSDTITVNPMTILPKPNEFVFNRPEAWRFWKERFLRFSRLAVRQWGYSEYDWIDLLCYTMGEQSEEIMEQIMPDVADKNLADVLQAFTNYFGQRKNVTLQRHRFNTRIQLPGESVEQFITVLRILAESCQYGTMKDELICDRIVAGLSDTTILEKLQLKSCLTLENVIAIAREAEIQRTQHDEVSQDSSSTSKINCAAGSSEAQQFPRDQSIDSKSLDQESCEGTGDRETGGIPKSVSCAKKKDGQKLSDHLAYNWRGPGQLELVVTNDEDSYLKTVYETVQQVMNDLKPQNFVESVDQIKMLEINSRAALQIAVELIHKKAVDKPSFSVTLALMCKELAMKKVTRYNSESGKKECYVNFKKLITTRCQIEFEKNTIDQNARAIKMKEIEVCVDPEKKRGLQNKLTKDENIIRIKSVDNIRFMGELFQQGMLTTSIMYRCIRHLLTQIDERSLECLCKLLSTIGKDLESTNQDLDQYFKQMQDIIKGKVPVQVSLRVLLMLQEVIDLRLNKWIPREDDSSPKTMGQIQKEAEAESLDTYINNTKNNRSSMDLRHDALLFPGSVKSSQSARGSLAPKQSSQQDKPKSNKLAVIPVSSSLREDVKLRETENAWKPGRMKLSEASEEDIKTKALYTRVREVLNKLTPEKFPTLVNQVRMLKIDSNERLQGVIDLVFEKAVNESSFSATLALMCRELAMMQVSVPDSKANKEETSVNFRKLIINRCQMEFEKNTVDETAKAIKMQEIEACADPKKKKELQRVLTEEERKIRIKSVGNIRFIGELFKQGMLTTNVMHRCIRHLLTQTDEQSIECLCKLLSTIGKDLESKNQNLDPYFKQMLDIIDGKISAQVSLTVLSMLQDVIELRLNKWIPKRDDGNPKTMDQIRKEAEAERLDTHMNNTPLNMPRKDDRNSDRKRNRGGGPVEEGGWSQPVRSRTQYSVETSELKNEPPPMDNLELGNKNMFQWSRNVSADAPKTLTPNKFAMLDNLPSSEQDKRSGLQLSGSRSTGPRDFRPDYKSSYDGRNSRNGSQQLGSRSSSRDSSLHDTSRSQSMSMPPPQPIKSNPPAAPASIPNKPATTMTEEQLAKKAANILEEYLSDTNINNAALEVRETFDNSTFVNFVRDTLNGVVEKSVTARKQVSQLMTHLISKNILPMSLYLVGLAEVTDMADDLVIDIPKIWVYLAELIWYPLAEGVVPFSELKTTMAPLKNKGLAGKLMGELMIMLVQEKGPKWIKDKWDQAGLEWGDFIREDESLNDFIKKYKLEFLCGDSNSDFGSLSGQLKLSMEQIHERLLSLMSNEKENSFDNICSWISANVGDRANEPQFIRVLMTAILEVSIEPYNNTFKFRSDKFHNLQTLISRYIDVNEVLEIQCLIAIQEHIHKLEHPSGVLLQIIEKLWDDSILSYDAFLAWESNKDPTAITGKSVAMMALTSFFTSLKEADDESSGEEA